MNEKSGVFSRNLFSLQLQLKTMLDGIGGEDATELLDLLGQLNGSERKLALKVLNRTLRKIVDGKERLETENDIQEKAFEEALYKDIMNSFFTAQPMEKGSGFSVLDGGKERKKKKKNSKRIIDFESFKSQKKSPTLTVLN